MNAKPPRSWRRRFWFLLALGAVVGCVLLFLFRHEILPESSPYTRGALVARDAGCFACHDASRPVPNFEIGEDLRAADSHTVPGILDGGLSADELRQWIENGISDRAARRTDRTEKVERHVFHMPAYRDHLDSEEIDDLVVFLLLEQYRSERLSESPPGEGASRWLQAERLARRSGCFTCHGELGQGGVANPDSHKGYVPGFQGVDFDLLTHGGDRAVVREWIAKGHSTTFVEEHLLSSLAQRTLDGQTIHMPAYEKFLSAADIDELVEYCLYLHAFGPLDRAGFERYRGEVDSVNAPVEETVVKEAAEGEVDFARQVAPILETSCLSCHGPEKQKSGYRLDRREDAMAGGELAEFLERPSIIPGDAAGSTFITFVEAVEEDMMKDIYPMPPKEEDRLDAEQIAVLRAWIDQGASWPDGITLTPRDGK